MGSFAKYVGGSPTNTSIGLARLGLKSALITRVGADHMGRFITEQLEREGVDTSATHSDPERLTALVILGIRDREQFPLIFYRENCADMALDAGDIDAGLVRSANAILINGTHLSTASVFEASMKAVEIAKESGGKVTFDVIHIEEGHGGGHADGEAGEIHDLVVSKKLADGSYDVVGRTPEIATGESERLTVELERGEYRLSCDIVEEIDGEFISHTVEGMVTDVRVS